MKKIILSISMMLVVAAGTVFATEAPEDNIAAKKSFQREFKGAEHVAWATQGEYSKAVFVLSGHRTEAWFNAEGELVGSARDVFYNQLPLVVSRAVDKKYVNAAILETREISNSEGTQYKIVLESAGKKYKITVLPDGGMADVQKLKK